MKKNLSLAGFSLVAMGLLMGSCVSKRKYMEAKASAAEHYRTDSTQWSDKSNTMQQNITSLEQKNTDCLKQTDSLKTISMTYQKRWDNIQTTYTEQTTSTEQLHQQIHAAIDPYVEASNIESKNGKIYVNLPENMLFKAGSSTLSTKGKEALDKLSDVLATNEKFEVDIIATAAYYNDGTTASEPGNASSNADNSSTASQSPTTNVTDNTTPASGSEAKQDPAVKSKATVKSHAIKKSNTATVKKNQGDRSMSFKSTPKSTKKKASTAPSWNLNVARSTAIVRQLTEKGLPQGRIVLTGQNGKGVTTNEWAATNRGYQVVVSPKMDSYYQKIQEGQGSTSMIK